MWVVVYQRYQDALPEVFGVFNNPDVARAWGLDNGYSGSWLVEVKKPNIADLFLVAPES